MADQFGPGMERRGRCVGCGGPLHSSDGERCAECRPQLSAKARAIGEARRAKEDDVAALEREARVLAKTIKNIERRVRWLELQLSKTRRTSANGC
jgi:hypothetical protein